MMMHQCLFSLSFNLIQSDHRKPATAEATHRPKLDSPLIDTTTGTYSFRTMVYRPCVISTKYMDEKKLLCVIKRDGGSCGVLRTHDVADSQQKICGLSPVFALDSSQCSPVRS